MEIRIFKKGNGVFLGLGIIGAVLSFDPFNEGKRFFTMSMYLCLAIHFFLMLKKTRMQIRVNKFIYYMVGVYIVWWGITTLFNAMGVYPHSTVGIVSFLLQCVLFYIIGYNFIDACDVEAVFVIIMSFTIAQLILMIDILGRVRSISMMFYKFEGKNQAGQMLGMGILMLTFVVPIVCKHMWQKAICLFLAALTLLTLLPLHSRTPLIGIIVSFILWFITKKEKKITDYLSIAAILIAFGLVVNYLGGKEYLVSLFLDRSASYDGNEKINALLSGRVEIWKEAVNDFINNPITGVGAWAYIDNHILDVLRTGGLLLGILIFPISYGRMFKVYKNVRKHTDSYDQISVKLLEETLTKLIPFLFVVSLMEGYPPLGPGSSMFFYWLVLGMVERNLSLEVMA